ncbi:hypothetical protein AVEN_164658-1 [Araneus ventricosus]|uniref:Uncharacterized protein n=1 Tax=Araneus ventricosus TaxID=182803 RepID=A0A4Y2WC45_ARAVE|nr:hypothetical protein AVEN_164658-1 [Araneus ventricosus]
MSSYLKTGFSLWPGKPSGCDAASLPEGGKLEMKRKPNGFFLGLSGKTSREGDYGCVKKKKKKPFRLGQTPCLNRLSKIKLNHGQVSS